MSTDILEYLIVAGSDYLNIFFKKEKRTITLIEEKMIRPNTIKPLTTIKKGVSTKELIFQYQMITNPKMKNPKLHRPIK